MKSKYVDLSHDEKDKLLVLFYDMYYDTDQDTEVFAKEFYQVAGTIIEGCVPVKLDYLCDYQQQVVSTIPRLSFLYKPHDGMKLEYVDITEDDKSNLIKEFYAVYNDVYRDYGDGYYTSKALFHEATDEFFELTGYIMNGCVPLKLKYIDFCGKYVIKAVPKLEYLYREG